MKYLPVFALAAACSAHQELPAPPPADPVFGADWAKSYTQVRTCRHSIDHDLNYVTVWTNATATSSYQKHDKPFPAGSVILKPEYQDDKCTKPAGFTAMRRETGYNPNAGDWHWQKAGADGVVSQDGKLDRCIGCHRNNCNDGPPDGYDWTCSAEKAN